MKFHFVTFYNLVKVLVSHAQKYTTELVFDRNPIFLKKKDF